MDLKNLAVSYLVLISRSELEDTGMLAHGTAPMPLLEMFISVIWLLFAAKLAELMV